MARIELDKVCLTFRVRSHGRITLKEFLVRRMFRKSVNPKLHVHCVVGRSNGQAYGGHLLEAKVWPTLEIIVTESPRYLQRRHDPETGLALLDLAA